MIITAVKCVVSTIVGFASMIGHSALEGKVWGKVEVSPTYIHLDLLESNKTVESLDMPAIRGDATIIVGNGWCFKPTVTYGKNNGEIFTTGIGIGHCIPIGECFIITPVIGYSYTDLSSTITIHWGSVGSIDYHERFRSHTPYAGLEMSFLIRDNLRFSTHCYWGWSYAETNIKNLLDDKSKSSGPNIGALLEYDLNPSWSVNIGGAWNESLGKTKDGVRAWGGKIGLARWF